MRGTYRIVSELCQVLRFATDDRCSQLVQGNGQTVAWCECPCFLIVDSSIVTTVPVPRARGLYPCKQCWNIDKSGLTSLTHPSARSTDRRWVHTEPTVSPPHAHGNVALWPAERQLCVRSNEPNQLEFTRRGALHHYGRDPAQERM